MSVIYDAYVENAPGGSSWEYLGNIFDGTDASVGINWALMASGLAGTYSKVCNNLQLGYGMIDTGAGTTTNNQDLQLRDKNTRYGVNDDLVGGGFAEFFVTEQTFVFGNASVWKARSNIVVNPDTTAKSWDDFIEFRISTTPGQVEFNCAWGYPGGSHTLTYVNAVGVGANDFSADPQFVDKTRTLAGWAAARSYGSTETDAETAIYADPTIISDLVDYMFEGFKPQNIAFRTSGHDGGMVGAANYHRNASTTVINAARSAALSAYGVTV